MSVLNLTDAIDRPLLKCQTMVMFLDLYRSVAFAYNMNRDSTVHFARITHILMLPEFELLFLETHNSFFI
jgi:hypothetical protein